MSSQTVINTTIETIQIKWINLTPSENRLIIINKKNSLEEGCHQLAGISNMPMVDRISMRAAAWMEMFKLAQVITGEERNHIRELVCWMSQRRKCKRRPEELHKLENNEKTHKLESFENLNLTIHISKFRSIAMMKWQLGLMSNQPVIVCIKYQIEGFNTMTWTFIKT